MYRKPNKTVEKFCNAEALTCLSLYSDIFSDFKLEIRIKFELNHASST